MTNGIPELIMPNDLAPFATIADAKAQAMIEDAIAQALTVAPCLAGTDLTYVQKLAVRGVLRTAILRWNDTGTSAKVTRSSNAGPFSESETIDTSHERRGVFWPSEIRALQAVCKTTPRPYLVNMGDAESPHLEWCSRNFGANYCDCGAELGIEPQ